MFNTVIIIFNSSLFTWFFARLIDADGLEYVGCFLVALIVGTYFDYSSRFLVWHGRVSEAREKRWSYWGAAPDQLLKEVSQTTEVQSRTLKEISASLHQIQLTIEQLDRPRY